MSDQLSEKSDSRIWFRFFRFITGLLLMGLGIWLFIQHFVKQPDRGWSVLAYILLVFIGVFIAISARLKKEKPYGEP